MFNTRLQVEELHERAVELLGLSCISYCYEVITDDDNCKHNDDDD